MKQQQESRVSTSKVEQRAEGDSVVLEGYSAVFETPTDIWGLWDETINKRAFAKVLNEKQDTRAVANHDPSLLLGRIGNGTLTLRADESGLLATITPNMNTSIGKDWVEFVRRGDVYGQSFKFTVAEDKWKFEKGKKDQREIVQIGDLYDVGPVTFPAFEETTIEEKKGAKARSESARSLFTEMSEAFGRPIDEMIIVPELSKELPLLEGERGRYVVQNAESRSQFVVSIKDLDDKPLLRSAKNAPLSVLKRMLSLRERDL